MLMYNRSITSPASSAQTMSRALPVEYFILAGISFRGDIVGSLDGRPIHDIAVDESGRQYRFAGVAPKTAGGRYNVIALSEGEWIVEPGLLYRLEKPLCSA